MFPLARSEHLTIQELPDEVLVFDHLRGKAHCLNRAAHLVWKHCDGRTGLAELATLLRRELNSEQPEVIVELALEQLGRRFLLQNTVERPSAHNRRSRRELLKKMAAAALVLPAILTVAAPKASAAGSLACVSNSDCSSLTANLGCLVGTCQAGRCTLVAANDGMPCATVSGITATCQSGICGGGQLKPD